MSLVAAATRQGQLRGQGSPTMTHPHVHVWRGGSVGCPGGPAGLGRHGLDELAEVPVRALEARLARDGLGEELGVNGTGQRLSS